ncbi:MAG: hypothetical protein ABSD98_16865 [Candidatus Korobacteraceae bacterium]|jgi:hypothetical protein
MAHATILRMPTQASFAWVGFSVKDQWETSVILFCLKAHGPYESARQITGQVWQRSAGEGLGNPS